MPLRPVDFIEEISTHVNENKIFPQLLGCDESLSQSCFLSPVTVGGAQMTGFHRLPGFWVPINE